MNAIMEMKTDVNNGKIVKFRLLTDLDELLESIDGEVIDCVEGCLMDNLLIAYDGGYIVLKETALNCWSSCYEGIAQGGEAAEVWAEWEKLTDNYEE